ncbi:GNAT family N-acetyltransferase [Specibacter sp. RAF43]|uniref:GNAT family N-acetyltransferase n=1 Tax=Specibacter sp. RAF43 TaxID=3233057 RepID=UPI003F9C93DA
MLIREAGAADWPGLWAVIEPTIRAGETYTIPTDATEAAVRALWLPEAPDAGAVHPAGMDDAGASPRLSRTFAVTEETGGDSPPMIVATATLHPNYDGPGSHIANASFMVHPDHEGKGYGRLLAHHVLNTAFADGYEAMVFNAVVESNTGAVHLWQSLGFEILATIPAAFRHPRLGPVGLHVMYKALAATT